MTTLRALWPVVQQFQNKSGSILAAGRVYIYYQGRTALATTYHDEAGTVVNSNPVLLDNNGRATVFADTIYSYTIVVCDYYGKELFSQDITLHDAISTAEDVLVMGSNGSVKVDTTNLPNGVQYDLSVNTDIIATKKSVDDVKTDLNNLSGKVDNNTTQIGQIKEDIAGIESTVANKKDKQNELNFNGTATKTITKISQDANGELNVEFADIDLPGYKISSSDGSINVATAEGVTDLTLPSDVVRDSAYTHIDAATANPLMNGTAAVGVSVKYAREDHIHPSDTSKEDIANKTTVVLGTSDSKYPTDKAVADFVNSSIATNTANYISNNGEPFTSVEQLEAYSGPVTNNDYAFVTGTDSEGNTYYDRYKATVSGETVTWALEYRLNNSTFTAAQWSAINSGITSALVAKIHDHGNKDVLDGITSDKVNSWDGKASTSVATTSANGLMSKTDKSKLDGIAAGAEANVQADWNSTNSSSDAFIKNKPYYTKYTTTSTYYKVCSFPTTSSDSVDISGLQILARYYSGGVNGRLIYKNGFRLYYERVSDVYANTQFVKFHYVTNGSKIDLYAQRNGYPTLHVAPLVNQPKSRVDFTDFGTEVPSLPEGATEIKPVWVANSARSSGTAPVKVNAFGDLTPVTMDTTPTADSTNPITSGGVKTAIDTVDAKGIVINEINGENVICFE